MASSRVPPGNGGGKFGFRWQENQVTIQLTSRSKQEMREIKRKLVSELELVKRLVKKIEEVGSKPSHQLGISVLENGQGSSQNVNKDKKTLKTSQFSRKPDTLLAKGRVPAGDSQNKSKSGGKKQGGVQAKFSNKLFKSCGSLLEKLMKHKHGWVFNIPVDPFALGLHDYFDIIKHPMDLGTVKSRLDKNWYNSPMEFAEDVRLTFHNAMKYNPKGQDVHAMAELLLKLFEEKWKRIEVDYVRESRFAGSNDIGLPTPIEKQAPPLSLPGPVSGRPGAPAPILDPKAPPKSISTMGRTPSLKKPKAKDLNKRAMTYDEKQKLSINLQNLPSEKLDNVVQIIKKRNPSLSQKDDEIEVDIDTFDTETLWELDRFVTNYKKGLSKNKRKAEFPNQEKTEVETNVQDKMSDVAPMVVDAPEEAKKDEGNTSATSPLRIDEGNISATSPQIDEGNTLATSPLRIDEGNTSTTSPPRIEEGNTSTTSPLRIDEGNTSTTSPLRIDEGNTSATSPLRIDEGNTSATSPLRLDEGNTSAASLLRMEKQADEQAVHVEKSSSSSSSSSTSGSSSNDSDSDSSSGAGSDAGPSSKA